jgi:MFS family permease
MGRVMSTVGVAVVLGPVPGPSLGGLTLAHLSWRYLFLMNVPLGVLALALGARYVPAGERVPGARLDLAGFALAGAGIALTAYGAVEFAGAGSLAAPTALASLLAGLAATAAFAWRSLRVPEPLLQLRLLGNGRFLAAVTTVVLASVVQFGALIILPLYFQIQRGEGVFETGLSLVVFGAGVAAMMPVAGWLTDRYGAAVSVAGMAAVLVGLVALDLLADASLAATEGALLLVGLGLGLAVMPAVTTAFLTVARPALPDAASQLNIVQRVGSALGSALLVVVLDHRLHSGTHTSTSTAFRTTFLWLTATALAAALSALWLLREQRRAEGR